MHRPLLPRASFSCIQIVPLSLLPTPAFQPPAVGCSFSFLSDLCLTPPRTQEPQKREVKRKKNKARERVPLCSDVGYENLTQIRGQKGRIGG